MKKQKHILPISIIIFFLVSIISTSCIDDSAEQEEAFNNMVDTLYKKRIGMFYEDLDSICESRMDSLILHDIDSIKLVRLKEIENLINK